MKLRERYQIRKAGRRHVVTRLTTFGTKIVIAIELARFATRIEADHYVQRVFLDPVTPGRRTRKGSPPPWHDTTKS